MDSMYLDNLEEFIIDENKIVTFKWLSLTLNVPSNTSKQMLYQFTQNHKKDESKKYELNITYFVSGLLYSKELEMDIHKVAVVREEDLEKTKAAYKTVFSIHIYSVQKSKLSDLNLLYSVNYDIVSKDPSAVARISSITCPAAKLRHTSSFVSGKLAASSTPVSIKEEKPISNAREDKENKFKTETPAVSVKHVNKKTTKEKPGIASMFANQSKPNSKKPAQSHQTKPKTAAPARGQLTNFFTKGPKPVQPPPTKESTIKKEEVIDEDIEEVDIKEETSEPSTESKTVSPKKEADKGQAGHSKSSPQKERIKSPATKKGKSKARSKRKSKAENPPSKRSRIVVVSDSSSEESEAEKSDGEPDEEPIPPKVETIESDEDVIPPTPITHSSIKGKKRKLVDKNFVDEDGFFVTKKEYELVSEDEVEKTPEKSPTKESPKKQSPISKAVTKTSPKDLKNSKTAERQQLRTKQSSIMSFFKKK